ncbi:lytic polysaccharide monooxygenase [Aulographum hederae CBS 113979]|uniref:AA9 family lytic polysaccharide monooxygenase n=1 Tax=Aulographum hederae CBS 113979 TaxID=1176131 RepID=A0A6G1H413_9PEZI|nr:lytic polysaccharide monooxygenase [Aulographum hederae CBS 113979]
MKLSLIALAADLASAHYIFNSISVDGQKGGPGNGVRMGTSHNSPVTDLTSPELRCNIGAQNAATVVPVKAGSDITFGLDQAVYHQGPTSIYMTKVEDAKTADGSTPWFKIKDFGATFGGASQNGGSWDLTDAYTATIPKCIADGDYLLRAQQIALHNPGSPPQFYIGCAQIHVSGGGNTTPTPEVEIPGAIKATDPGLTVNIYNGFTSYEVPGPAPFTC